MFKNNELNRKLGLDHRVEKAPAEGGLHEQVAARLAQSEVFGRERQQRDLEQERKERARWIWEEAASEVNDEKGA
jgi:hypothetical protein